MTVERIDLGDGLYVDAFPGWLRADVSAEAYRALDALPFERRKIRMFGRELPEPRDTLACGERYMYSGIYHPSAPMPEVVRLLRDKIEGNDASGFRFNQALVTRYLDGKDSIGWHADNEPELDPMVASVSLGATRRFLMRGPGSAKREIALTDGMLLVMGRGVQRHWQHSIPKQANAGPRISITFRRVRP